MENQDVSRRTLLKGGAAALAGLTVLRVAGPAHAFGQSGEQVIPWLDQPAPNPIPDNVGNLLKWEELDSWLTPADNFFFVSHYGQPDGLDESTWHVSIAGLVARPQSLTLADLKARARHEVDFTLECSGNTGTGLDFFIGGVGNARWAGTRLAPLLQQAGVLERGTEVVFYGVDHGTATIRDNSGIVSGGG
jgi:DMSO/TMAO reductase YedYZ molybdopterin-dependent catalytic subunit